MTEETAVLVIEKAFRKYLIRKCLDKQRSIPTTCPQTPGLSVEDYYNK